MSDTKLSPDDAAQRARELIEADTNRRVDAVRNVVAATIDADAAERQLKDATTAHERAWRHALDAGWSEKDLRATGARPPGQPTRQRRPRTTTTGASSPTSEQ